MRSNSKYGIGVIGTNFGFTVVAPAIIESSYFELICVANSSPTIPGEYYAETTTLKTSETDLISNPKVDVVWIATPPETHFELLKKVLSSGKIAICEKPCGNSLTELTTLKTLAEEIGVPVYLDFEFRYDPIYASVFKVAKNIRADQFFRFNVRWQSYANAQKRNSYSHKDFLLDFAIHILDCFLNFANEIGAQLISSEEIKSKCSVCDIDSEYCVSIKVLFDRFSLETTICRNYTGVGMHEVELLNENSIISSGITHPYSSRNLFYSDSSDLSLIPDKKGDLPFISYYPDMRIFSVGLLLEDIANYMSSNKSSNKPPDITDALRVHKLIDDILESELY